MTKFNFGSLSGPAFEADWPVTVNVPQDGGKVSQETFTARFRVLTDEEVEATGKEADSTKAQLRLAVVGSGKDEDWFSADVLEQLMSRPNSKLALLRAYNGFSMGLEPTKN